MANLLVSGDSWTSFWPLEEKLGQRNGGWPSLVSDYFGYNLIDKSRAGSSNYRIYRKAFEGILDTDVDLVIVFLTSWIRNESGATYGEKPGRIYQHLPSDKDVFALFFNSYLQYSDSLRMIISLQALSEKTKKQCYFLDTFKNNISRNLKIKEFKKMLQLNPDVFNNMDDERIENKFSKIKSLENNIDWDKFISQKSYEELIGGYPLIKNHPGKDGHKKMSEIVIQFIKEVNNAKAI